MNSFDFSEYDYEPSESSVSKESPEQKEEPSWYQKLASNPATQFGLGLLKAGTVPLDILKMIMIGEGVSDIDEVESAFKKAGKPFDREEYVHNIYKQAENIPTQDFFERLLKEKTGIDTEPKTAAQRTARGTGEILSFNPAQIAKNTVKEGLKSIAKKGGAALSGGITQEGLKQVGVSPPVADLAGFLAGGGLSRSKGLKPKTLTPEGQSAKETAEKFGLRRVRGAEEEMTAKGAVVGRGKVEEIKKELGESSKKAIDDIISDKIPVKKLRDNGVDLKDLYTELFADAENIAKSADKDIGKSISMENVVRKFDEEIYRIQKKAPAPSDADKIIINALKKQKKALSDTTKSLEVGANSPHSRPIPGSPHTKEVEKTRPKKILPSQIPEQIKNFNENVKGIYRKAQFTGAEERIKNLYGSANKELIQSLHNSGETELAGALEAANKAFSYTQKLEQTESILSKAFETGYDPKKLLTILGGKSNRVFLERSLGKEAIKDMKDIAIYGKRAHDKVLSQISSPKTIGEYVDNLTPLQATIAVLGKVKPALAILPLGKAALARVQGALITRKTTSKAYKEFLKDLGSNSLKKGASNGVKIASDKFLKAVKDEFGSEEELVEFAKED